MKRLILALFAAVPVLFLVPLAHAEEFEFFATLHSNIAADDNDLFTTSGSGPKTLVTMDPGTAFQRFVGYVGPIPYGRNLEWNPVTKTLFTTDFINNPGVILEIDPVSGVTTPVATIRQGGVVVRIITLAFTPEGQLYGVNFLGVALGNLPVVVLGTIDLAAETFEPLVQFPAGLLGRTIDISPDGILYMVDTRSHTLLSIDLDTLTILSEIDLGRFSVDDIDYAPDGYIYHSNFSYALIRLDPATGEQTLVGFANLGAILGIASRTDLPCDADGDGDVDWDDAQAMLAFLLQNLPLTGDGDCNEDGEINFLDHSAIVVKVRGAA